MTPLIIKTLLILTLIFGFTSKVFAISLYYRNWDSIFRIGLIASRLAAVIGIICIFVFPSDSTYQVNKFTYYCLEVQGIYWTFRSLYCITTSNGDPQKIANILKAVFALAFLYVLKPF